MTKLLPLTLLCIVLSVSLLQAQSAGKMNITTGIGLTPVYHGKTSETNVPALSLQVGYDFGKAFSLGAFAGYTAASSTRTVLSDGLISKMENKTTALGLRGEFRRDMTDKLLVYGGLLVGYKMFDIKEYDVTTGELVTRAPNTPTPYDPNAPKGQVLYSGFVGAKYYLKKRFGLFAELGYGLSLVNVGTTFKL